jgi:hypothetical protein
MNNILFWSIQEKPQFPDFLKTRYDGAFQPDKTIIVDTDLPAQVGEGMLLARLESMSLIQAKDTLVFCFIDSIKKASECNEQAPENYVRQLHRLVCAYPEVTFRFIEDSSEQPTSSFNNPKKGNHGDFPSPKCFIGNVNIGAEIKAFEVGQRDVFDPDGIRAAIRSGKWEDDKQLAEVDNIKKKLASIAQRPCAYILENERDYSELVGYCAYRSGKYRVRPILTQTTMNNDEFKIKFKECTGGVLIHAWGYDKMNGATNRESFKYLEKTEDITEGGETIKRTPIKRMVITGAGKDVVKLKLPKKWDDSSDPWLAWTPSKVPKLRGLQKPLEWIHDIQNHGLLPEWTPVKTWPFWKFRKVLNLEGSNPLKWIQSIREKGLLLDWTPEMESWLFWNNRKVLNLEGLPNPFNWIQSIREKGLLLDWTPNNEEYTFLDGVSLILDGHHAAKHEAQEMAQQLLNRSRIALKSCEPLLAAIFSLEAIRWLRGHSSTLLLDSVQSLYEAETELELGFGSSGRSSRTEAPGKRAEEINRLMEMLSVRHKMPKAQVPEMKERIWTALRRRYLEVGAFEPAESALKYIHDAHSERMGQGFFIHPNRLMYHFPKKGGGLGVLLFLAGFLIVVICRAPLIETDPLGHSGWNLSWSWPWFWSWSWPWFWSWKWFWSWSSLALVTPFIVLFALVGLWARHWPSAALSPSKWAITVFLSISVLSAGNLALLSDPSDLKMITEHRLTAYSEAVAWTCGSALAQVLPNKFIHTDQEPKHPPDSLSFGWRGKTRGANADPDLIAVEDTQFLRTFLWLENVIVGWLSFATGLSTIYRKASRS